MKKKTAHAIFVTHIRSHIYMSFFVTQIASYIYMEKKTWKTKPHVIFVTHITSHICMSFFVTHRTSHIYMSHATRTNESVTHQCVMSHVCMSHVEHMNESHHTYKGVMLHIEMRNAGDMCSFLESRHTYEWVYHTYEIVMSHTYGWIISHIWMSHVTHMSA